MRKERPISELLNEYIIKGEIDTKTREITIKSLRKKEHDLVVIDGGKGRDK